jgi:hypothetical protein
MPQNNVRSNSWWDVSVQTARDGSVAAGTCTQAQTSGLRLNMALSYCSV